jgi:hypothetical protein
MHVPINVKSPNNISKWQMGFNSAFKGLRANGSARPVSYPHHTFCGSCLAHRSTASSAEYGIILPLSIYSTLSLPEGYPVAAQVFFVVFSSLNSSIYISIKSMFQKAVSTSDVTNPVRVFPFYWLHAVNSVKLCGVVMQHVSDVAALRKHLAVAALGTEIHVCTCSCVLLSDSVILSYGGHPG